MQQVGSLSGPTLESLTVPRYKSVRGFHASSLLMPPHLYFYHTYIPTTRSLHRGGFVDGFILFLWYMCVLFCFCPVCQAAQIQWYTLANWQLLLHRVIVIVHEYCGLFSGSGNPGLHPWYCTIPVVVACAYTECTIREKWRCKWGFVG